MTNDPIADMLTILRNAAAAKKQTVCIDYSKMRFEIAKILKSTGYIGVFEKSERQKTEKTQSFPCLVITLVYDKEGNSAFRQMKRISSPGRKVYRGKDRLPKVLNGYGMAIMSTSKGLMTNKEAFKQGVGGELVCEVY